MDEYNHLLVEPNSEDQSKHPKCGAAYVLLTRYTEVHIVTHTAINATQMTTLFNIRTRTFLIRYLNAGYTL